MYILLVNNDQIDDQNEVVKSRRLVRDYINLCYLENAEGINVEEVPCRICILLCTKDRGTSSDFLFLLHRYPIKRTSSSNKSSQICGNLYPFDNHHSECSMHPKV